MLKLFLIVAFLNTKIIKGNILKKLETLERTRRATNFCTYSYNGICERRVRDNNKCFFTGFRDCYSIERTNCTKQYLDCCVGDVMDDGICYGKDEPCDDCYTIVDCKGNSIKLQSRTGSIKSDNHPQKYAPNQDCLWTIRGPRNSTIYVDIVDFDLEAKQETDDCEWDWRNRMYACRSECVDWVLIRSGSGANALQTRECGNSLNWERFITIGSSVDIGFHTDASEQESGFHLRYTIVGGVDPGGSKTTTIAPTTTAASTTTQTTTATETTPTTISTTTASSTTPFTISTPFTIRPTSHPKCPGKLIWSKCPKCTRTCNNYLQTEEECVINFSQSTPSGTIHHCRAGCECPREFSIWHKLDCVTQEVCGRTVEIDPCKSFGMQKGKCIKTCEDMLSGRNSCIQTTVKSINIGNGFLCVCPPGRFFVEGSKCVIRKKCQSELNKRCAAQNKVWSTCLPQCEQTCTSNEQCNPSYPCKSGCACPGDKPIYHKGICIAKSSCPIEQNIVCGKQHYSPILKIQGGRSAVRGSWPWLVQIEKMLHGKFALACGGTLICKKWVLTASHCFLYIGEKWIDYNLAHYRLHIGKHHKEYNLGDLTKGMLANIVPKRILTHDDYDTRTHVNDIALIELPNEVPFNRLIRPACIFNVSHDYHPDASKKETCMSAGWGAESSSEMPTKTSSTRVLKQVELAARLYSLCMDIFYHFDLTSMHCVGGHKNQDTCAGDSGGPLMCKRGDRWYVDGVVSFGLKCGVKDQPGVYTRVPYFSAWIQKHTGKQCGDPGTSWKPGS